MSIEDIQTANQQTADRLIAEARQNPNSPYTGKFVGIANGQIVVVADDWDELAARLGQVAPELSQTLSLEVAADYDDVQYIWGLFSCHAPGGRYSPIVLPFKFTS